MGYLLFARAAPIAASMAIKRSRGGRARSRRPEAERRTAQTSFLSREEAQRAGEETKTQPLRRANGRLSGPFPSARSGQRGGMGRPVRSGHPVATDPVRAVGRAQGKPASSTQAEHHRRRRNDITGPHRRSDAAAKFARGRCPADHPAPKDLRIETFLRRAAGDACSAISVAIRSANRLSDDQLKLSRPWIPRPLGIARPPRRHARRPRRMSTASASAGAPNPLRRGDVGRRSRGPRRATSPPRRSA